MSLTRFGHLSILIFLTWAGVASANWQSFDIQVGLPDNRVNVILEDQGGSIWFGTAQGVTQFDGIRWTFASLGNNLIRAALLDRDGNLWFGTAYDVGRDQPGTLWRFDVATSTWEFVPLPGGDSVSALGQDSTGTIWISTDIGLVRHPAGGSGCAFIPGARAQSLFTDRSGLMWLLGGPAICFDPQTCQFGACPLPLQGEVLSMAQSRDGRLWFGTSMGVTSFDPASGETRTWAAGDPESGPIADRIQSVMEDSRGRMWFATPAGTSRFDGSQWRHFTQAEGLIANDVRTLLQDGSGNVWLGTVGGASRFDGVSWTAFNSTNTAGALVDPQIQAAAVDSAGRIWFGTRSGGVVWTDLGAEGPRAPGPMWGRFGTDLGSALANNNVRSVLAGHRGFLWFGTYFGASRLSPATGDWTQFNRVTTSNQLADDRIETLYQDRAGNVWFGTPSGVSRLDAADSSWKTLTVENSRGGLANNDVLAILEDRDGAMWFGTDRAYLSRFSPVDSTWTTYAVGAQIGEALTGFVRFLYQDQSGRIWTSIIEPGASPRLVSYDPANSMWTAHLAAASAGGLGNDEVHSVCEDRSGNLWFGTRSGLSRFNGRSWQRYSVASTSAGLPNDFVQASVFDSRGDLWLGTISGASRHEPDRTAPQTLITLAPPDTSANRLHSIPLAVAYGETDAIEYSTLLADSIGDILDPDRYSPAWSSTAVSTLDNVADGTHYFGARARDGSGNVDPTPTIAWFVVEATPPSPVLANSMHDAVAHGLLEIRGTTVTPRFRSFALEHRTPTAASTDGAWQTSDITLSRQPDRAAVDTLLGVLDTRSLADGEHELRLSVTNSLNLTGTTRVTFRVDNQAPPDSLTSPVQINHAGGDVYALDGRAHAFFPAGGFSNGARVVLDPGRAGDTIESPAAGVRLVDPGYAVSWGDAVLDSKKTPTLDFQVADSLMGRPIAVWRSGSSGAWERVGGSVDRATRRMSCPLLAPATYALFAEAVPFESPVALSGIRVTPRVFALREVATSGRRMAIAFRLGQASGAAVRIYNRAGRLVRDLADGSPMGSGENVIYWDGRNRDGELVLSGFYLVTIMANGAKLSEAVVVTE